MLTFIALDTCWVHAMNGFSFGVFYSSTRAIVGLILLEYFDKYIIYHSVHDAVEEVTRLQVASQRKPSLISLPATVTLSPFW